MKNTTKRYIIIYLFVVFDEIFKYFETILIFRIIIIKDEVDV